MPRFYFNLTSKDAHISGQQERLASPDASPQEKEAIRASISRRKGNGKDD